jgi:hypothetical protein
MENDARRLELLDRAPGALIAKNLKVMYTPVPKSACTSLKYMLSQAEGTYSPETGDYLVVAALSRKQLIHEPLIHGLTLIDQLETHEIEEALASPDWLRLCAVRDPVARAYSAWENRIFLRVPARIDHARALCPDVMEGDLINVSASFDLYTQMLIEHPDAFMSNHHFWPHTHLLKPHRVAYDRIIHVNKPGEMDSIASLLSERSGKEIVATRMNEGLRIPVREVCSQASADRIVQVYKSDYDTFDFEAPQYEANLVPRILSSTETAAVRVIRDAMESISAVSKAGRKRVGFRYGLRQIKKSIKRRLKGDKSYGDLKTAYW